MTENEKTVHETIDSMALTDDQLDEVIGGFGVMGQALMRYTRCSADPTHVFLATYSKCPVCGAKQ